MKIDREDLTYCRTCSKYYDILNSTSKDYPECYCSLECEIKDKENLLRGQAEDSRVNRLIEQRRGL